jgi:hypothetical protein
MADESSSSNHLPEVATTPRNPLVQLPGTNDSFDRAELEIPEEPPADAIDHTPIPKNWGPVGEHWEAAPGESRLFAVSARIADDAQNLHVRYIHPSDKKAAVLEFRAVEIDNGYVPHPAYKTYITNPEDRPENFATFPLSFGHPGMATVDDEDAPTAAERRFIWARYTDFLVNHTLYLPPTYDS